MDIEKCIDKICSLPLDFRNSNDSAWGLAAKSEYLDYYGQISLEDIKSRLIKRPDLILAWDTWSSDKRTEQGLYFKADDKTVGLLTSRKNESFENKFETVEDACSFFILEELKSLLHQN